MSDETIQYITTDYLIEVDGGEPAPAPIEYIVELGQVGVQGIPGEKGEPGFSPTVGYILNNDTFKINITNQDGVTQTPNLYDYLASKEDLNGYLKVDGSNANNPININNITFRKSSYQSSISTPSTSFELRNTNGGSITMGASGTIISTEGYLTLGNGYASTIRLNPAQDGKAYYGSTTSASKEIATIGDISDATITLTQGGVTKGTFTLNGSATTIDLDAGGSAITNPLHIGYTNSNTTYNLSFGVDETTTKVISSYIINTEGSTLPPYIAPIKLLNDKTAPITLTETVDGLYTIGLDYDTNTLKVENNKLTVIGGGGGSYTAGTGIDITNDTISIDTSVVAQLSDIPDTSDMATKTWVGNQGYVTTSDLSTTLADYVLSSSLATVATSGSYSDLSNKPTIPTNSDYVDLTTDQTVGGTKTFSNDQKFGGVIYLDGSSNAQGVVHKVGSTRKELVLRNNSASMVYVGNTSDALNLRGSGARPTYYTSGTSKDIALYSDIPSLTNYVTNTDYATTSVGGVVKVDDSTITIDANGVISATSDSNKADKDLSNITTITNSLTSTAINPLINKLTNADITTAPSNQIDTGILYQDTNDNNLGGLVSQRFTNGVQATAINATNKVSGTTKIAYFNVYVDTTGNDHADASSGAKSNIVNWTFPQATMTGLTLATGTNYTRARDGYFYLNCSIDAGHYIQLTNTTRSYNDRQVNVSSAARNYSLWLPAAANDTVTFDTNGTVSGVTFGWYPVIGEVI